MSFMLICTHTHTHTHSDIEKIQSGIGDKVAVFLSYFSTFISGYIIAFSKSWKLALVVMTMLPLIAFISATIAKVVTEFSQIPRVSLT